MNWNYIKKFLITYVTLLGGLLAILVAFFGAIFLIVELIMWEPLVFLIVVGLVVVGIYSFSTMNYRYPNEKFWKNKK